MVTKKRAATQHFGQISTLSRTVVQLGAGLAIGCASPEGEGVSYSRDVQPLFERRCVICHHSGNPGLVDIEDPFTPDFESPAPGLVGSRNLWAEQHALPMPAYNLAPFDPASSFVLQKVTDRELRPGCDPEAGYCKSQDAGFFMPPAAKRLPDYKLAAVRLWIELGALEDDFYRQEVQSVFGTPASRSATECEDGGMAPGCIVCISCHYEGSPDLPDLTQPFDPIVGIIGVKSTFRADLDLVTPGDPDSSFLVHKLEALGASSEVGAPMPYGYRPLSDGEVDVLTRWIAAGAPNN